MAGTFTFMSTTGGKAAQMASGNFNIMVQAAPNPVPTVTTLTPPSTPTGGRLYRLGIVGSDFVTGATANFGGVTALVSTQIFPNQVKWTYRPLIWFRCQYDESRPGRRDVERGEFHGHHADPNRVGSISSCTLFNSLVTIGTTGNAASLGGSAGRWSINSTGCYIAFTSPASDLVSGVTNTNGYNLAYVRDTCLGAGTDVCRRRISCRLIHRATSSAPRR
jgi:hypothetical protein